MSPSSKELLGLLAVLAVVLGCGYGAGALVTRQQADAPPEVPLVELEDETLAALRRSLELRPEQEPDVAAEVGVFTAEVVDTRRRAVLEYHNHLLRLHDRLMPRLDPDQQRILRRNREQLERTIERRFPTTEESR